VGRARQIRASGGFNACSDVYLDECPRWRRLHAWQQFRRARHRLPERTQGTCRPPHTQPVHASNQLLRAKGLTAQNTQKIGCLYETSIAGSPPSRRCSSRVARPPENACFFTCTRHVHVVSSADSSSSLDLAHCIGSLFETNLAREFLLGVR